MCLRPHPFTGAETLSRHLSFLGGSPVLCHFWKPSLLSLFLRRNTFAMCRFENTPDFCRVVDALLLSFVSAKLARFPLFRRGSPGNMIFRSAVVLSRRIYLVMSHVSFREGVVSDNVSRSRSFGEALPPCVAPEKLTRHLSFRTGSFALCPFGETIPPRVASETLSRS
jgi:hypothetical protein